MPDCCAWHRSGGHELMACNDGDAQTLLARSNMVAVSSVGLAKLKAEIAEIAEARRERDAEHEIAADAIAYGDKVTAENVRLRAALEPTPENVEALAQAIFVEQWNYPGEEGPPDKPPPPWQEVIDEGSADGWRYGARAVLEFLSARAGLAKESSSDQPAVAGGPGAGAPGPDASARALVATQANDEALWCPTRSVEVAYLQQALRALHAAVEGTDG